MTQSTLSIVGGVAILVAGLAANVTAQDDPETPAGPVELEETYFKGVGRGDVHSPGWAEIMALKGEPIAPRFPRVGDGIERFVLANGMAVYLAEDHTLPLVRAGFAVRAGEAYETEEERGITSALLRRMRSGGTDALSPDDVDAVLERLSVQVSARPGADSSGITLDTLSQHLAEAFDLFVEIIRRPSLQESEAEDAGGGFGGGFGGPGGGRGGRGGRNPSMLARREFTRLVYGPDHPAARGGGFGRRGGFGGGFGGRGGQRFSTEALIDAYDFFIRPDNACLAVSGDFDSAAMRAVIERAFGDWPAPEGERPQPIEQETPPFEPATPGVYAIDVDAPQSAIVIGHLGVDKTEADRYAIALMNDVLGGGSFTSRVTERVRSDEGLAYSAASSYPIEGDVAGTFQVSVQTRTEMTARAIQLILEELDRMRQPGTLSRNEFETARDATLYSYALQFSDASNNVARIMRHEVEGRPLDYDEQVYEGYQAVTPQSIEAAALEHIRPDDLYIVVAGKLSEIRSSLESFGPVEVVESRGFGGRRGR